MLPDSMSLHSSNTFSRIRFQVYTDSPLPNEPPRVTDVTLTGTVNSLQLARSDTPSQSTEAYSVIIGFPAHDLYIRIVATKQLEDHRLVTLLASSIRCRSQLTTVVRRLWADIACTDDIIMNHKMTDDEKKLVSSRPWLLESFLDVSNPREVFMAQISRDPHPLSPDGIDRCTEPMRIIDRAYQYGLVVMTSRVSDLCKFICRIEKRIISDMKQDELRVNIFTFANPVITRMKKPNACNHVCICCREISMYDGYDTNQTTPMVLRTWISRHICDATFNDLFGTPEKIVCIRVHKPMTGSLESHALYNLLDTITQPPTSL
jgi:hypothetical protein